MPTRFPTDALRSASILATRGFERWQRALRPQVNATTHRTRRPTRREVVRARGETDRCEVQGHLVARGGGIETRRDDECIRREEQRVAIVCAARGILGANHAARAGAVVDHPWLTGTARKFFGHDPGDGIGEASRRGRHDDAHRLVREAARPALRDARGKSPIGSVGDPDRVYSTRILKSLTTLLQRARSRTIASRSCSPVPGAA